MEGSDDDYASIQQKISAQLVATTRSAGQLAAEDLDFLRASDRKAGKRVDRKNAQLLELAQRLMTSATQGSQISPPDVKKPSQIDENWRGVADVIDNLLERADRCLDEYTGVITKLSKDKEQAIKEQSGSGDRGRKDPRNPRIHPLEKPQLLFRRVPKNDETTPFKPLLTTKPHAQVPLDTGMQPSPGEGGQQEYAHPYQREIERYRYPQRLYERKDPIPPIDDPDGKTLTWVDTPEMVAAMLAELKEAKDIAVDLEHHDAHSYVGLVSLMQISTRGKDWIVDTLKPWREDLQSLNEVFADPSILKVLHGSTMDMIWLQRDLGIYVVGLFDTYHATNALQYPRHGLAYLLKRFEDFDAQKQYQMADWRTRPLSAEMMQYARSDTHYLLHIYDCIRNELIENSKPDEDLVDYVLQKSKAEALQKYERFIYNYDFGFGVNGWLALLWRTPAVLSNKQFAVFRAVHQLRDQIARGNDESLISVMRNDTVFTLAREMPESMPGLLGVVHPVGQFLQPKLSALLGVIKAAKANGDSGPSMDEIINGPEVTAYQERTGHGSFKRRFEKKLAKPATKPGNIAPALAEIIRTEREKAEEAPKVALVSAFWGNTLDKEGQSGPPALDIRLRVPLPDASAPIHAMNDAPGKLNSKVGSSLQDTTKNIVNDPAVKSENKDASSQEPPGIFSINKLRRQSRKRKAVEEEGLPGISATDSPVQEGEASANVEEEGKDSSGAAGESGTGASTPAASATAGATDDAKKSKKRKKADKRAAAQAAREAQMDEPPFDYAAAPDVLEGAASGAGRGKGRQQRKNVYDPYAKALDAPKGLPRKAATGGAGRSKTFKS